MIVDYSLVLFGICAATLWGISDFFGAKSTKLVGPILSSALINLIGSVVFIILFVVYYFLLHPHLQFSISGIILAILSGISIAIGGATFFVALKRESVSIVSPITGTYPLFTTIVVLALFHAHLTHLQILAIMLVVTGIIVVAGLPAKLLQSKQTSYRGSAYAVLSAAMWGTGFALLAQAILRMNWQLATLIESVCLALTLLVLIPRIKGNELFSQQAIMSAVGKGYIYWAGIIQVVGQIALILGLTRSAHSGGAIVTTVSACYPLLTIFLALKSFDERVKVTRILGALIGVIGILILTFK